MSSYLEAYGAAEEQRAKRARVIKITAVSLLFAAALALILYGFFRNYPEEQRVKSFIALLQKNDYRGAYALWGCTDAHPCSAYPFDKFMEDWGPKSEHANESSAHLAASQSCGTGVILQVNYSHAEPVSLWVERDTENVGFAPWPECPGRHLHLGAWLRSLFGS